MELGMSETTFFSWKAIFGGMDTSNVSKLKEVECENAELKIFEALKPVEAR